MKWADCVRKVFPKYETKKEIKFQAGEDLLFSDRQHQYEKRGIRVVKNRSTMEHKLIEAMTKEFMKGEN